MKNLELAKKRMFQIFQPREKTVVKCYSDDLCELWFSGHMHSIFYSLHWVIFLSVSFWGGKWLKKLVRDYLATGTFQEM